MQARGLKPQKRSTTTGSFTVAPHAGAWIETLNRSNLDSILTASRLMQARGLKPDASLFNAIFAPVAPHAGAWIETYLKMAAGIASVVAPHAGAWIET